MTDFRPWISEPGERATEQQLATITSAVGRELPRDFHDFYLQVGGGEWYVGEASLIAFPAHDLLRLNEVYNVEENAPGLLLFGSNGAGEGYALDTRQAPPVIVVVPFIGMSLQDAVPVAPTFTRFLEKLASDGSPF